MALGDPITLDDPTVTLGGTDISDAVAQAQLTLTHNRVSVPMTFGKSGALHRASSKYTWQVTLDLITDGYGAGTLDGIVTTLMPAPLGASTTGGVTEIVIKQDDGAVAATNPSYTGDIVLDAWDPLGSGQAGDIIRNSRTFMGTGDLTKASA